MRWPVSPITKQTSEGGDVSIARFAVQLPHLTIEVAAPPRSASTITDRLELSFPTYDVAAPSAIYLDGRTRSQLAGLGFVPRADRRSCGQLHPIDDVEHASAMVDGVAAIRFRRLSSADFTGAPWPDPDLLAVLSADIIRESRPEGDGAHVFVIDTERRRETVRVREHDLALVTRWRAAKDELERFDTAKRIYGVGELRAAQTLLDEICASTRVPPHRTLLAKVCCGLGEHGRAEEVLTEALSIDASDAATWLERGRVRLELERFDDAISDLREAERLASSAPINEDVVRAALVLRGRCHDELGEVDEALAAYETFTRTGGESSEVAADMKRLAAQRTGSPLRREPMIRGKAPGELTLVAYRELGYSRGPSLAAYRGKRSRADKAAVVKYLASAPLIVFSPGVFEDVFVRSRHVGSLSIRTDGTFAWYDALAHYVREHDLELPPELEEHMARRQYRLPEGLNVRHLRLPGER